MKRKRNEEGGGPGRKKRKLEEKNTRKIRGRKSKKEVEKAQRRQKESLLFAVAKEAGANKNYKDTNRSRRHLIVVMYKYIVSKYFPNHEQYVDNNTLNLLNIEGAKKFVEDWHKDNQELADCIVEQGADKEYPVDTPKNRSHSLEALFEAAKRKGLDVLCLGRPALNSLKQVLKEEELEKGMKEKARKATKVRNAKKKLGKTRMKEKESLLFAVAKEAGACKYYKDTNLSRRRLVVVMYKYIVSKYSPNHKQYVDNKLLELVNIEGAKKFVEDWHKDNQELADCIVEQGADKQYPVDTPENLSHSLELLDRRAKTEGFGVLCLERPSLESLKQLLMKTSRKHGQKIVKDRGSPQKVPAGGLVDSFEDGDELTTPTAPFAKQQGGDQYIELQPLLINNNDQGFLPNNNRRQFFVARPPQENGSYDNRNRLFSSSQENGFLPEYLDTSGARDGANDRRYYGRNPDSEDFFDDDYDNSDFFNGFFGGP